MFVRGLIMKSRQCSACFLWEFFPCRGDVLEMLGTALCQPTVQLFASDGQSF